MAIEPHDPEENPERKDQAEAESRDFPRTKDHGPSIGMRNSVWRMKGRPN